MNDYSKTTKGVKGFIKKYEVLGELKQIKVPIILVVKIKRILELLEKVARKHNIEKVQEILDKIIIGLEKL